MIPNDEHYLSLQGHNIIIIIIIIIESLNHCCFIHDIALIALTEQQNLPHRLIPGLRGTLWDIMNTL